MRYEPVRTLEELDSLDFSEMRDGYLSAERGDPEPGPNRGKAFWHGWRNRMMDHGELPQDDASRTLVRLLVERLRNSMAQRRAGHELEERTADSGGNGNPQRGEPDQG